MYKEMFRTKGIDLTAGELKEAYGKEFDDFATEATFEGMDLTALALPQFGGFAEEVDGYTVILVEDYDY